MARVKRGVTSRKRHKREIKEAKGYRGGRSRLLKSAREANLHAGMYAFRDRRARKRDMRKMWIVRINAAVRAFGLSYKEFIYALKKAKIELNRKLLSELAIQEPQVFSQIVDIAKKKIA